jgi:serine/threonine-protein kinase HipA
VGARYGGRAPHPVAAANHYELSERDARSIIDGQIRTITERWDEVADSVGLTSAERSALWRSQVLNPFATFGYLTSSR